MSICALQTEEPVKETLQSDGLGKAIRLDLLGQRLRERFFLHSPSLFRGWYADSTVVLFAPPRNHFPFPLHDIWLENVHLSVGTR